MNRTIVAVCLAIAPLVAVATIYKVRMPDGSILFTDSPPAGAKILEERASTSPPRQSGQAAPPRTADRPSQPAAAPVAGAGRSAGTDGEPRTLDAAMAEITDAERALAVARRKLEAGREPLPGERLGTANGRSRLSPEYEDRIAGLEREVAEAEARVKRAHETRNSLR
jgi:hypothetical protein